MRTLVVLIGLALATFACAKSPTEPSPTPVTVALDAAAWTTISDPEPYPLLNRGPALMFEFPQTGSMHYLFTPSPMRAIHGTLVVSFTVTTNGPVVFNPLDTSNCNLPTSVRPFFWANDNAFGAYDRWWSNPRAFTLAPGDGTVTVPLKPENWSSVNGKFGNTDSETRFAFEKAILNITRLGVTFGGGCSFGHGINISGGTATFALTKYAIQ